MSVSPTSRTIICQEIFDENSIPSEEEIIQFAKNIGINPDTEPHLLLYAKDGLMQPLPKDWTVCLDQKYQQPFYYNSQTKESSWEHPLDAKYRNLISKIRSESASSAGDEDSKTSAREDLKSFEVAGTMHFSRSLDFSEKLSGLAPLKKTLSPITKPQSKIAFGSNTGAVKKDIFEKNDAKSKMNLDLIAKKDFISESIDVDKISSPLKPEANRKLAQEKHPRGMNRKGELTLSGDGAKFLKSNQKTDNSPLSASTPGFDSEPIIEFSHSIKDEHLKSILREKTLWDIDPTQLSSEDKVKWRKQELEEEKKSVRFDLDKQLSNIKFNLSDSEEIEEEDVEDVEDDDGDDWSDEDEDEEEESSNKEKKEKQRKFTNKSNKSDSFQAAFSKRLDQETQKHKIGLLGAKLLDFHKEPVVKFKTVPRQNSESQIGRFTVSETKGSKTYDPDFVYKKFSSVDSALPKNRFTINLIEVDEVFKKDKDAKNKIAFSSSSSSQESSQSLKQNEVKYPSSKEFNPIEPSKSIDEQEEEVEEEEEEEDEVIMKKESDTILSYETKENEVESNLRRKIEQDLQEVAEKLEFDKQLEIKKLDEERMKYKVELEKEYNDKKSHLENESKLKIQELITQKQNELEIILEKEKKKIDVEADVKIKSYINQRNQELELLLDEEKKKLDSVIQDKIQEMNNANQLELENKLKEQKQKLDLENNKKIQEFREIKKQELNQMIENEKLKLEKESEETVENIKKDIFSKLKTEKSVESATQCEQISFCEINLLKQENIQLKNQIKELESSDLIKEQREAVEKLKIELEREMEEKRLDLDREQVMMLENMKAEQVIRLEKLRQGFKREEEAARQEHAERMVELRARMELERQRTRDRSLSEDPTRQELIETSRVFEKMRCEKRLLEDKYRTLKEKYIRLKGDVKSSMERRRRREGGTTTETETEKSSPHKASHSLERHVEQAAASGEKPVPKSKPSETLCKSSDKDCGSELSSAPGMDSDNVSSASSQRPPLPVEGAASRRRRHLFARLKSASTSRLIYNNNNNNNVSDADVKLSSSPVENLRRQLQKLDDLEDQFPAATHTDTYMRYPFKDTGRVTSSMVVKDLHEHKALLDEIGAGDFGSCELEFFRHRIHLERDSVRRAKAFLRAQRGTFRSRQRELRQRQTGSAPAARNMLDVLYQEERELSDMEVSLHRTRSLLGEKIIRLRHLEHSVKHASPRHQSGILLKIGEDATLSDLSSHSGSSGFSSTELHTPADGRISLPRQGTFQESNEIIQSLENLNSEIREIWEVLSKQQKEGQKRTVVPPPPPPLIYPEVGSWPHHTRRQDAESGGNAPVLPEGDPTLIERTKSLRDWLRQARNESIDLVSPSQATL